MTFVARVVALIALLAVSPAWAGELTGAGSTFVAPILTKWSEAYAARTGTAVTYRSIGSGGGLGEIKAQTVDFAISDAPLKPRDLQKFGLAQFPVVVGGIVPVVNVEAIKPGDVVEGRRLRRHRHRLARRGVLSDRSDLVRADVQGAQGPFAR